MTLDFSRYDTRRYPTVSVTDGYGDWSAHYEEACRAYYNQFFEAVKVRQAASICEDGIDRQRDLDVAVYVVEADGRLTSRTCAGSWNLHLTA